MNRWDPRMGPLIMPQRIEDNEYQFAVDPAAEVLYRFLRRSKSHTVPKSTDSLNSHISKFEPVREGELRHNEEVFSA